MRHVANSFAMLVGHTLAYFVAGVGVAFYNIGYAAPFVVVPAAVAISGEQAQPLLEKINGVLGKLSDIAMPWMFGLLGLVLVADSAAYVLTGEGLIQF